MDVIVEAVPMVLQVPMERVMPALEVDPVLRRDVAGPKLVPVLLGMRAGARLLTAPLPVRHGSGRTIDHRDIHADRTHQEAGRGLVAAAEQHRAIDRMRAQNFLRLHGEEVAIEHGGRLHHHLADRQGRQLDRVAAHLPDSALHRLRALAQMRVARAQVAPGVEDGDHRLVEKLLAPHAHLLGALAVREAAHVVRCEPALAAKFLECSTCHSESSPLAVVRANTNRDAITESSSAMYLDALRPEKLGYLVRS